MKAPAEPSLLALATGFVQVGLTSVGGAAAPLRNVIVVRRRWLTETEFSELFGIAQALPGATAANLAVMIADRFAGPLGALCALAGLCIPSMLVAIGLAASAVKLAEASPRFAAGEMAVTAAVAGLFIGNGLRLAGVLWAERGSGPGRRSARIAIAAGGIVLIVGFHLMVPIALVLLAAASMFVEWRAGTAAR
jgi:chromate transporter